MPSALLQVVIAVTVMMPPGTYRTLQMLARHDGISSSRENSDANESEPALVSDRGDQSRQRAPVRARDWSKVTFTSDKQGDCRATSGAAHLASFCIEFTGDSQIERAVRLCRSGSGPTLHPSPRAALLALQRSLT